MAKIYLKKIESGAGSMTILGFNDLFAEPPVSTQSYLMGISKETILKLGRHFLAFRNQDSEQSNFKHLLQNVLSQENADFGADMLARLDAFQLKHKSKSFTIINPESSLSLFQHAFLNGTSEQTQSKIESEQNVLLAYLAINQEIRSRENSIIPSIKESPDINEFIPKVFFAQGYTNSDLINYDESELIVCQVIKSIYFFDFLKSDKKYELILDGFLKSFQVENGFSYVSKILPLIHGIITREKKGFIDFHVNPNDPEFANNCNFLDKLILKNQVHSDDVDFASIRQSPLQKISDGVYGVIYSPFVIEKLYKSLYFNLEAINVTLPSKQQIKNLHSEFANHFSERNLVYITLNHIFRGKGRHLTGDEAKEKNKKKVTGEPDYYARKENLVFIFESKDFRIKRQVKMSYNFNTLQTAFKKKLLVDGTQNKAIRQIIKNIQRVFSNTLVFDEIPDRQQIVICPIIILHDHQYNVMGLNRIVNNWFLDELKQTIDNSLLKQIMPVTLINMDSLIYNQDALRDGVIDFEVLVRDYAKEHLTDLKPFASDTSTLLGHMLPFSKFIARKAKEAGVTKPPEIFRELWTKVFEWKSGGKKED